MFSHVSIRRRKNLPSMRAAHAAAEQLSLDGYQLQSWLDRVSLTQVNDRSYFFSAGLAAGFAAAGFAGGLAALPFSSMTITSIPASPVFSGR